MILHSKIAIAALKVVYTGGSYLLLVRRKGEGHSKSVINANKGKTIFFFDLDALRSAEDAKAKSNEYNDLITSFSLILGCSMVRLVRLSEELLELTGNRCVL